MKLTLDTYFDKIFYINLIDDVDRNNNILKEFEKYNITNFERIEGIRFDSLPESFLWRNFNQSKLNEKYVIGSMGARASHLTTIKISLDRNYKRILILEDDIYFTEDPNIILNQNLNILNDWDMLYFGGEVEHFFRNQIVGAYAYGIDSKLFLDILNMAPMSGMEIDNFYAKILQQMSYNYNQSGKFNIRSIEPFNTIKVNYNYNSNIR